MIELVLPGIVSMVQPCFYVDPRHGNDRNPGTTNEPFQTISAALRQSEPKTTIQLRAGHYCVETGEIFPLIVPEQVKIVGQVTVQRANLLISGSGLYRCPDQHDHNVCMVLQAGATLQGVTLINPAVSGTGIWIAQGSVTIAHSHLQQCQKQAIFAGEHCKPVILHNLITQNSGDGIVLKAQAKGEISHNQFRNNHVAIALADFASPLISHNHINQNQVGLDLSGNTYPVLRRNELEHNCEAGLILRDHAQVDLGSPENPAGNILRQNGEADLWNHTERAVVSAGNKLSPEMARGLVTFVVTKLANEYRGVVPFWDVENHWAEPFITALVTAAVWTGELDRPFQPDAPLTRADYAVIVARCFNLPRPLGLRTQEFGDLPTNPAEAKAIAKALTMGFLTGFADGTVRPQAPLTRVQAFVFFAQGLGLEAGDPRVLKIFQDRPAIPSDALGAIAAATQHHLVVTAATFGQRTSPPTYHFRPLEPITRAEFATLLHQALVLTQRLPILASPYILDPAPCLSSFVDVQNHWAKPFIAAIANLGLIRGSANSVFKPDHPLNRSECAVLITDVFNPRPIRPFKHFLDIPASDWATAAIQAAYRGKFMSGFPDGTFHPQQQLRRVHLLQALADGLDLPDGDLSILDIYGDREQIPHYARPAVAAATQCGLVVNYPECTLLDPQATVTRAQAIAIFYQALVYRQRVKAIDSPYIVKPKQIFNPT